ncbi:BadF/BadG/BcrA/BcrD ATPase family protein [Aliirhizobium terrae]|uniref:BadF/BadG/BcrA/BcrD ATPase family protein n=1 Tax=Terrirhizobium terrae TaxID=2926709 RepID=UPI0035B52D90
MTGYVIGIDGGGTSCRAALADANGGVLGRGKSGASNILTDPDTALKHIVEAAELAFEDAGIAPDLGATSAILGLAGNNVGDAVGYVRARLPFKTSEIVSDGVIALQGAIGDEDGAIGIVGTGTVYIIREKREFRSIAGWGFQVSDLGSGARLGQLALQETLLAFDRISSNDAALRGNSRRVRRQSRADRRFRPAGETRRIRPLHAKSLRIFCPRRRDGIAHSGHRSSRHR